MSRLGTLNPTSLQKYNGRIVELAQGIGMKALAERMGVHFVRLHTWARGERLPDFRNPAIIAKYQRAENYALCNLGMTLAEVFEQPEAAEPEFVPLKAADGPCDPIAAIDLRLDIERLLAGMKPEHIEVLRDRSRGATFEQIAEDICGRAVSRGRAQQIESEAISKAQRRLKGYAAR